MSWTETDLVGLSTDMELLPEGTYVFELLPGSKKGQWDPEKIEVGVKVVEGDYAGRVVYFSYNNPEKSPAMYGAFKRLEIALSKDTGVSIVEGQHPVDYLNDPTVIGGKFIAPLTHREYVNNEGETQRKTNVGIFKVKAVA